MTLTQEKRPAPTRVMRTDPRWLLPPEDGRHREFLLEQDRKFATRIRDVYFPEPKPVPELVEPEPREEVWPRPTAAQIIRQVAEETGVLPLEITGRRRTRRILAARRVAIKRVAAAYPDKSFPWIGQQFGRDHTTIMHQLGLLEHKKPKCGAAE